MSIDYGIVMSGDITCIFDDGKRVVMHPGDVIIQRGTLHAWLNETTEWTRMYFVLLREYAYVGGRAAKSTDSCEIQPRRRSKQETKSLIQNFGHSPRPRVQVGSPGSGNNGATWG